MEDFVEDIQLKKKDKSNFYNVKIPAMSIIFEKHANHYLLIVLPDV